MSLDLLHNLAIALGLGLIVGLQREWVETRVAGIRTFPLICMFGVLSAALADRWGGWILAAGFLALASTLLVAELIKLRGGRVDPGVTTEVAALMMFAVGAALVAGHTVAAVTVGGAVAVLLHWKRPMHEFVSRIGRSDLSAVVRLVLIALVILPLLPNRSYGLYEVINPFEIWLMVVLIVGISLGAYLVYRMFGARAGTLLAGALGGLISSTATTVSYARHSRNVPGSERAAALVIVIASTSVFARVLLEIALVAPDVLPAAGPPLTLLMLFMAAVSLAMFLMTRTGIEAREAVEPASNLGAAIVFGLLYAAVLVGIAGAKRHFGEQALYAVSMLSGLTDMDAITLSTARLVSTGTLDASLGWRLIVVGALANVVFKGLVVAALGSGKTLGYVSIAFAASLGAGLVLLGLWP
jgi:uncharacterized membrane protein (DUF4010 family)